MLSIDEARRMAKEHITHLGKDIELIDTPALTDDFGWVFGYRSKLPNTHLAGNAPLLIDRHTMDLHVLGTGRPTEYYVKNYIAFGDPHKVAAPRVTLVSCGKSVRSIDAMRCVRDHSGIGLKAAKDLIEKCISGIPVTVDCHSVEDAEKLVAALTGLGYIARQLGE